MARREEELRGDSAGEVASPASDAPALTLGQEIVIILVFTAALLTLLSLASYHPYDPGFLSTGTLAVRPDNLVGYVGAFWADILIHLLGLGALWVPALLARAGYLLFVREPLLTPRRLLVWTSLLLSQATLLQIALGNWDLGLYGQSASSALGGLTGIVLGTALTGLVGDVGALVLVPLWVVVTLMVLWRVSLFRFAGRAAAPFGRAFESLALRRERARQADAREEARVQVKQKQKERLVQEEKRAVRAEPPAVNRRRETGPALPLEPAPGSGRYKLPTSDLLEPAKPRPPVDEKALLARAKQVEDRLQEFDVAGEVVEIHPGPVVTIFEYRPAPGIKYNRVIGFAEDLALTLKVDHVRIDRIAGKSSIGIEVPNREREIISFRELVESETYRQSPGHLPVALGKTVDGEPYVATLAQMPHLLVAGTTGSGKSVGINAILHSILFRATPDEVKLILIDPKQVELKIYEGVPHLLTPVVTDVKKAANALNWAVREMTERYKLLAAAQVRSIDQYNQFVKTLTPNSVAEADLALTRPLPYVVIVIDELYDLMAVVAKEVETSIARLSAMARAVGIHLIIATQRPSRDVITGVIKSNLPSRIAYQVREKLESRLILDQNGAEMLEGKGDMLFLPAGSGRLLRLHGGFLSTVETQRVIAFLKKQGDPVFDQEVLKETPGEGGGAGGDADDGGGEEDPLYKDAVSLVVRTGAGSASNLQRKMRIGYARAARLLDVMEQRGIVGPADGAKPREILVRPEDLDP